MVHEAATVGCGDKAAAVVARVEQERVKRAAANAAAMRYARLNRLKPVKRTPDTNGGWVEVGGRWAKQCTCGHTNTRPGVYCQDEECGRKLAFGRAPKRTKR